MARSVKQMGQEASSLAVDEIAKDEMAFLHLMVRPGVAKLTLGAQDGHWVESKETEDQESEYLTGRNLGLFAKRSFEVGEVVVAGSCRLSLAANDAMFDIRPILRAQTAVEMENALREARAKYYDLEKGNRRINVVMSVTNDGEAYIARRAIAQGEEILRVYGFSTWIKELLEQGILKRRTLPGLLNYVAELHLDLATDPFAPYLNELIKRSPDILARCFEQMPAVLDGREIAESAAFDALDAEDNSVVQVLLTGPPVPLPIPYDLQVRFGDQVIQQLWRMLD